MTPNVKNTILNWSNICLLANETGDRIIIAKSEVEKIKRADFLVKTALNRLEQIRDDYQASLLKK